MCKDILAALGNRNVPTTHYHYFLQLPGTLLLKGQGKTVNIVYEYCFDVLLVGVTTSL